MYDIDIYGLASALYIDINYVNEITSCIQYMTIYMIFAQIKNFAIVHVTLHVLYNTCVYTVPVLVLAIVLKLVLVLVLVIGARTINNFSRINGSDIIAILWYFLVYML